MPANRILCCSFNKEAAQELGRRLREEDAGYVEDTMMYSVMSYFGAEITGYKGTASPSGATASTAC